MVAYKMPPCIKIQNGYAEFPDYNETFAECSILFKFKEGENFNHRNILDISRIKI